MPALFLQGAALQNRIFEFADSRFPSANEPGFCAAGLHDGEVKFTLERGLADLRRQATITRNTNFRLASMTKQFTAAAVLLLRDAGNLDLSASLVDLFEDFPAYGAGITVRHLLNHTSGLISYESLLH